MVKTQPEILEQVAFLLCDENTSCHILQLPSERERKAGTGFELIEKQESFAQYGTDRWGIAVGTRSNTHTNAAAEIACVSVAGKLPENIEHLAVFTASKTSALNHEAKEIAEEAEIPIIVLSDAFSWGEPVFPYGADWVHLTRLDVGRNSAMLYEQHPEYTSRFTEEDLLKANLLHLCSSFTPKKKSSRNKKYSDYDVTVAAATIASLSFGKLSLPEGCEKLDLSDIPEELLMLSCPSTRSSRSWQVNQMVKVAENLLHCWCAMLTSYGVNLIGNDITPNESLLSPAAIELARKTKDFEKACKKYAQCPISENLSKLQNTYDEYELRVKPPSAEPLKITPEIAPFMVVKDIFTFSVNRNRYDIYSSVLDGIVDAIEPEPDNPKCQRDFILVRDGFNAFGCNLESFYTFANIEYVHPGKWAVMLLGPSQDPLVRSRCYAAYAILATRKYPKDIDNIAVITADWQKVDDEICANIAEDLARAKIPVLADETGRIEPNACSQEEIRDFLCIREEYFPDEGIPFPSICFSQKLEIPAETISNIAPAYRRIQSRRKLKRLFSDDNQIRTDDIIQAMRTMSLGHVSDNVYEILSGVPSPQLSDPTRKLAGCWSVASMFDEHDERLPHESWETHLDEMVDLRFIWKEAVETCKNLVALSSFPMEFDADTAAKVAEITGVEKLIEAYYKGVPIEDILSGDNLSYYNYITG